MRMNEDRRRISDILTSGSDRIRQRPAQINAEDGERLTRITEDFNEERWKH